ncbi:hypothetical protein SEPCBS119000_003599 [Sporothrix epigloea]|uniref:Uncharacterized protein n=1 Tax=Sporothrix epigloea TaxID=1892477 RepID=A0ABP0DMI5_9PEZI
MNPCAPPPVPTATFSGEAPNSAIHSQHSDPEPSSASSPHHVSSSTSIKPDVVDAKGLPLLFPPLRPDASPSALDSPARDSMLTGATPAEAAANADNDPVENATESDRGPEILILEDASGPPEATWHTPHHRPSGRTSSSASPSHMPGGSRPRAGSARRPSMSTNARQTLAHLFIAETTLIIEEISDFDSDNGRIQIIRPFEIEEAESEREKITDPNRNRRGKFNMAKMRRRSSARLFRPPELDRGVTSGLREFTFGAESDEEVLLDEDDGSDYDDDALDSFLLRQRDEKRRRRMTSGSISKRTITESIGSDTDTEDLSSILDANDVGSSARRLRRRLDRHSLQFQDPPPPRIDELDEPDTSDNEDEDDVKELIQNGEFLARELPYYTLEYISMEVDSP